MKNRFRLGFLTLGMALLVTAFTVSANASCGDFKTGPTVHKQSWGFRPFQPGTLLPISEEGGSIVGMWHVTFTAQGNDPGPPDGVVIDNALVTLHSDGTEIMNSGRPPQDGQFCMGVWKKAGRLNYKVNHIAWGGNDAANAPGGIGNPAGPTHLVENITLSADGNQFTGKFTLDAYDTTGNVVAHIVGTITGTRITIDTKVEDLL